MAHTRRRWGYSLVYGSEDCWDDACSWNPCYIISLEKTLGLAFHYWGGTHANLCFMESATMKLFGLELGSLSEKIFSPLNKEYSLTTEEGKPFRLMKQEQYYEIITLSKKAPMISGNIVEHLCEQLINIRLLSLQLVDSQKKNNSRATRTIIEDLEKIV